MIPAAELTQMRADAAALLDKTCVIERATKTGDGYGSQTDAWATIATVDAGMKQPSAGVLQNYDFLIGSLATWHVNLPYGTDCIADDLLSIDGLSLQVQVILAPQSYAVYHAVLAAEVL